MSGFPTLQKESVTIRLIDKETGQQIHHQDLFLRIDEMISSTLTYIHVESSEENGNFIFQLHEDEYNVHIANSSWVITGTYPDINVQMVYFPYAPANPGGNVLASASNSERLSTHKIRVLSGQNNVIDIFLERVTSNPPSSKLGSISVQFIDKNTKEVFVPKRQDFVIYGKTANGDFSKSRISSSEVIPLPEGNYYINIGEDMGEMKIDQFPEGTIVSDDKKLVFFKIRDGSVKEFKFLVKPYAMCDFYPNAWNDLSVKGLCSSQNENILLNDLNVFLDKDGVPLSLEERRSFITYLDNVKPYYNSGSCRVSCLNPNAYKVKGCKFYGYTFNRMSLCPKSYEPSLTQSLTFNMQECLNTCTTPKIDECSSLCGDGMTKAILKCNANCLKLGTKTCKGECMTKEQTS